MDAHVRKAALAWYPGVLAATMVLAVYADADISIAALWRPLGVAVIATLAAQATLGLLLRSPDRAAALTAALLVTVNAPRLGILLVATVVGLTAAIMIHARRHGGAGSTTLRRLANPFSLILLATVTIVGGAQGAVGGIVADIQPSAPVASAREKAEPNVYLILVDGYPRADTLRRLFDYDNDPFLAELERRGFDVASHSRSNYMWTELTLASMLQMRHIEPEEAMAGGRRLIVDNPVFDFLHTRGYGISANAAVYEGITLRSADRLCGDGDMTDFEFALIESTTAWPILRSIDPSLLGDRHRRFTEAAFACLDEHTTTQAGHFVYTHVPVPHLPIVFDADGSPASVPPFHAAERYPPEEFKPAYLGQVEYVNDRVLEAVDDLLAEDAGAVVIVMSDHGSESDLDWDDPHRTDHDERFSTLFAARTPGLKCLFGDAPTPVNLFPTLFNAYFDTDLPLQPDTTFISDAATKLRLEEVPNPDAGRGTC